MSFKMATSCISVLMYNYKLYNKREGRCNKKTLPFFFVLLLQEFSQKHQELFEKDEELFGKTLEVYYSMSSKITLALEEIGLT